MFEIEDRDADIYRENDHNHLYGNILQKKQY